MVEDKDIISTITASGLALTGLVLVFLGLSLNQLTTLLDTGQLQRYWMRIKFLRFMLLMALGVVILGVVTSGVGMGWLLGCTEFYDAAVALFFVTLSLTALLAIVTAGAMFT